MTAPARIHIDALTYGPHGIGRIDGKATFVRGVVPGEDVEVVVREEHARYTYADAVRILHASHERREAPCPFLPACGGCPWQHIAPTVQLAAKTENLRQALQRIGHWSDPPVLPIQSPTDEFHYRSRLSLRTDRGRVGFYEAASHDLIEIDHCLLASDAADRGIGFAADLVRTLPDAVRRVEVLTCERTREILLVAEIEGSQLPGTAPIVEDWLARNPVAGVVLHGRRWRRSWGRDSVSVFPEPDLELTASAGAFTQVSPVANRQLVADVLGLSEVASSDRVLDLYAGIGNLTLPLARRANSVVAVEQSPVAAADARTNAARQQLTNIEVRTGTTRAALRDAVRAREHFNLIVLDPPRSGAAEAVEAIVELAPERLVYVSCNPATLARDLSRLAEFFDFDAIQPIDLFPQTYHLETVVRGRRRDPHP